MALVPMQTMNLQLETFAFSSSNDKTEFQGESSFSKMLELASNDYAKKDNYLESDNRNVSNDFSTHNEESNTKTDNSIEDKHNKVNDINESSVKKMDDSDNQNHEDVENLEVKEIITDEKNETDVSYNKKISVEAEKLSLSEKEIDSNNGITLNLEELQKQETVEIDDNALSFLKSSVNEDEIVESTVVQEDVIKEEVVEKEEISEDQDLLFALLTGQDQKEMNNTVVTDDVEITVENPITFSKDKNLKSDKPVIQVIDERTINTEDTKKTDFVTTVNFDDNGNAEMNMSLSKNSVEMVQLSANSEVKTNSTNFSEMLSNEIKQNASEFVKTGSIVLKDGNKGTINLILHPDELGNVKIQLELSEKVISAKIVVGSEEAYNAFKSSLSTLKEAFAFGGFEDGGFDLSWSNDSNGNGKDNQNNPKGQMYQTVLNSFNDGLEDDYGVALAHDAIVYGSSLVNMVV